MMDSMFETWWTALRVPIVGAMAVAWLFLLLRRKVDHVQMHLPTEVKPNISSSLQPQTIIKTASEVESEPVTERKTKKPPKKFIRTIPPPFSAEEIPTISSPPEIHIFYASQFSHTSTLAKHLMTLVPENTRLHDISLVPNLDDYFLQHPSDAFYFLLLPSYANNSGPAQPLIDALEETLNDFRVDANPLQKLVGFAVFGTGDKEGWPLKKEFCYQAAKVEKLMEQLGARRAFTLGTGNTKGRIPLQLQIEGWANRVLTKLNTRNSGPETSLPNSFDNEEEAGESADEEPPEAPLLDVEDIGSASQRHKSTSATEFITKPMVSKTSTTYQALTKQGYTIVGTHSGVKICRWTKSALRGRGSCYKFSFYGIKSHLCMETTPSLACANKCVFCWRHGTNPVGTTWRWQVDPPEVIYKGALEGHYAKINMLKGMMGVKPARYEEAKRVRHCALSLVGEPIFCMCF